MKNTDIKNVSLESLLNMHPELVFPRDINSTVYDTMDKIIGAIRVFDYIVRYLKNGYPIFAYDGDNQRMLEYMTDLYIDGFGTVNTTKLQSKPRVTGSMLSIPEWEFVDPYASVHDLDLPSVAAIVAELVARQDNLPYDVLCMQEESQLVIRQTLDKRTQSIRAFFYDMPLERVNLKGIKTKRGTVRSYNEIFNERTSNIHTSDASPMYRGMEQYDIFTEGPHPGDEEDGLEQDVSIYLPAKDYYISIRYAHLGMTKNGERIYESE